MHGIALAVVVTFPSARACDVPVVATVPIKALSDIIFSIGELLTSRTLSKKSLLHKN